MHTVSGSTLRVWSRGAAIVVAVLVALVAASATAHARGLKLVQDIGTGGSGLPLTSPRGVAVNNVPSSPCYGDLYVVDMDQGEIEIGGQTLIVGSNVWRFTSDGAFEDVRGQFGSGDGEYKRPFGIAIDNQGNVLVTDSWYASGHVPNARVQMFTCELDFITKWGVRVPALAPIEMDHMLDAPAGIDVGSDGKIYVADSGFNADHPGAYGNRIVKFSGPGLFERTWGRGVLDGTPVGQVCTSSCRQGSASTSGGVVDGEFDIPNGVAVDRNNGSVYVADTDYHRIQKFDSSGNFESAWGAGVKDGSPVFQICTASCRVGLQSPAGFSSPESVHVADGVVYVADKGNNRLRMFDTSGKHLADEPIFNAQDVATDDKGGVYVTPFFSKYVWEAKKCSSQYLLKGTNAGESLAGTSNPEKIYGRKGDDTITGGDDTDCLYGGSDDDTMSGGDGDDRLVGSSGDDTMDGGAGQDRIYGGGGDDTISAGDGESDVVKCGGGFDTVLSHDPSDILIKCESVL